MAKYLYKVELRKKMHMRSEFEFSSHDDDIQWDEIEKRIQNLDYRKVDSLDWEVDGESDPEVIDYELVDEVFDDDLAEKLYAYLVEDHGFSTVNAEELSKSLIVKGWVK